MKLNVNNGMIILDVTEELVAQAIRDMLIVSETQEFVILDANKVPACHIEARLIAPWTWEVAWVDLSIPHGYRLASDSKSEIIDMFGAFFRGDTAALSEYDWMDVGHETWSAAHAQATPSTHSMNDDVTHILERIEQFEARLEVSIGALFAAWSGSNMQVNGEVRPVRGMTLEQNIRISCVAYDESSRVIESKDHYCLRETFFGFDTFTFSLYLDNLPAKVRIFPKAL
jgi:hypothetical protein